MIFQSSTGNNAFDITVYPNPVTDVVNGVQNNEAKGMITEVAGKTICTVKMNGSKESIT